MAIYSVMAPREGGNSVRVADETIFVPDRFSLAAAAMGPFWLGYIRNWRALLAWVLVAALIGSGVLSGKLSLEAAVWCVWTSGLFLGLQAHVLVEDALARRGFGVVDIVTGQTRNEAERIFFRRQSVNRAENRRMPYLSNGRYSEEAIVGLFPTQEGHP